VTGDDVPAPPTSSGPEDSPGFMLWRATLRWQRTIAAALRPVGLTHVQFVLLASVWWLSAQANSSHPLPSQRAVAAHAGVDVMMTSQVLRALERRGLLARATDPTDARVKRLTVTQDGRRLAEQAISLVEEADALFFDQVQSPAPLLDLLRQLSRGPAVAADQAGATPAPPSRAAL
jgi:DNA-binding MarR family transcriptional regulator